ncbi:Delta(9)-fatty-acid desaturase fat-7 [Halotydeus destructor]|nr:Delta(9)-fatty-acid desaturase fat-7 [Halotydeus destructor]
MSMLTTTSLKPQPVNNGKRQYWYVDRGFFGYDMSIFNILLTICHIMFPLSLYELVVNKPWYTFIWVHCLGFVIGFSITSGSHLLWSHKSYEARWPLKVFYMIGHTISSQFTMFRWMCDHRIHHKWSDTDGDPHNPSRGMVFAHVGWVYRPKHPEMLSRSRTLDFSDLWNDPIVRFQYNYYVPLFVLFGMVIPTAVPMYFWNESLWTAFLISVICRIVLSLHITALGNSASHFFGDKPYSSKMAATDSFWTTLGLYGSGYHNYHHMFPSDYASSEPDVRFNLSRDFIRLMAKLGLAYNLKTASQSVVDKEKDKVAKETKHFYGRREIEEKDGYDVTFHKRGRS